MSLSNLSIKRGITFTMIYLIVIGFGIFGLTQIKLDLYPNITIPVVGVMTQYTGVGPEDIENVITRPLEQTLVAVENVDKIISMSSVGSSLIILQFDWNTDIKLSEMDVRKNIDLIRDYLPPDASDPITLSFDPSMTPVMLISARSGQLGMAELRRVIDDDVRPRIERIKGVASATSGGGLERQIKVLLDPQKVAAFGIPVQQIVQKLQMENVQIPAGIVDDEYQEYSVRTYSEYKTVDQISNTVIGNVSGTPIYLKNVANVIDGYKEQNQIVRNNGEDAVMLFIQKQSDANTVQTARAVTKELPKIMESIGKDLTLEVIFDTSDFITKSLNNLVSTAVQAFILTFLVLLFFLRHIRSSLVTAISIPVSIIVTFFVMYLLNMTFNVITMAGLALGIGMLVDNSIVVLENIFRLKSGGIEIKKAADEGASEVSMAITASTLTTLAIFIPVLFLPGISGVLFKDLVVVMVSSLTVSLLIALTLVPLLSTWWLKGDKKKSKLKILRKMDSGVDKFLQGLQDGYVKILDYFLGHKKVFLAGLIVIFVITILMFPFLGGEFLPEADRSSIRISVERETGSSLASTDRTFREIERIIREEVPEAKNIQVNFGVGEGLTAIMASSNSGSITIRLPDVNERERTSFEIQDILRERFKKIPGANITIASSEDISSMGGGLMGGDISVNIFGYDRLIARELGDQVADMLTSVKGVVDVTKSYSLPKPEYQIIIDRDKASALGLSTYQIASIIGTSIRGTRATRFREQSDEYDVIVQLDKQFRKSKADIENIYITTPAGAQIPLNNVATVVPGNAEEDIIREDQERRINISCSVSGRDIQSVTRDITAGLKKINFPSEFRWEIGGMEQERRESFMYLYIALAAAIILVYMVMASQFESFLEPFIIIFTIPLAMIGVIWLLFITKTKLSVMALVGCVLLVGIVINNGIVLVDYINQLRYKHNYHLWIAILAGGRRRLRPVLMTALTTIFGMLPLALGLGTGAELWAPMALAVIGGLTFATVFTLILIPIIYLFFEQVSLKRKIKKGLVEAAEPIGRPEGFDINLVK
ncbi:MAG TPA: efflux RND transporter permease subunit [Candidatus Marinimicrobia bacterium]|nr:efflux RND transporter permease subunit [Candidatus Neomarinimicrobiota bacterium]HRS52064.1 efflux RND transporter permease subunit [Candidatus Neomarinimicrobiota bacterium]HRU93074.1 efflux RND transporter permease subunit [Candidatus Neomarinimicrobiota bacterium]